MVLSRFDVTPYFVNFLCCVKVLFCEHRNVIILFVCSSGSVDDMVWSVPTVLVGEFDSLHGAKMHVASQFYKFDIRRTKTPQLAVASLMSHDVLVGKCVSTGPIAEEHSDLLKPVAVRALATSDSAEDCVVWTDPVIGALASLTFHVGDILARGEKRKFCLVATHPNHDTLLARWPLILLLFQVISRRWSSSTQARVAMEYTRFANLPAMRDSARRSALRSLFELVADESGVDTALASLHNELDVSLPQVFGCCVVAPPIRAGRGFDVVAPGKAAIELSGMLTGRVSREECVSGALSRRSAHLDERRYVTVDNSSSVTCMPRCAVRPLALWLREMFVAERGVRQTFALKAGKILRALVCGNQIMVSASREELSENWALALAEVLPRSLRQVVTRANAYRESYQCRIISFSDAYLNDTEIVHHRDLSSKDQLVLSELQSTGAIHVYAHDNEQLISVDDCDALIATVDVSRAAQSNSQLPTPVRKILSLVEESYARLQDDVHTADLTMLRNEVEILQAQLCLVVQEYVSKGRLYVKMFQQQEMERNARLLGMAREGSHDTSLLGRLSTKLFKKEKTPAAQHQQHSAPPAGECVAPSYARSESNLTMSARLETFRSPVSRPVDSFDLCDVSAGDHPALIFLGSARLPCTYRPPAAALH